jgi:RNA polymerase sigma factor (TIGR02999 family)
MSGQSPQHAVTDALMALRGGAHDAMERLMSLVYDELRHIAHRQLRAEPAGHTLSTTGLVHEAYLKLVDQRRAQWADRAQFFCVAAQAMRRILVDYARRHHAARRGGPGRRGVALDVLEGSQPGVSLAERSSEQRADALLALDEALERLAGLNGRLARVVECRYFVGLTEKETAETLGISQRTVAREWLTARGWLYQELHDADA